MCCKVGESRFEGLVCRDAKADLSRICEDKRGMRGVREEVEEGWDSVAAVWDEPRGW